MIMKLVLTKAPLILPSKNSAYTQKNPYWSENNDKRSEGYTEKIMIQGHPTANDVQNVYDKGLTNNNL